MDATLREITGLVKEVNPDARSKGTYFDFSLVTPELRNSGYRMREIGVTCSGQKGADDNKTLAQARYTKYFFLIKINSKLKILIFNILIIGLQLVII